MDEDKVKFLVERGEQMTLLGVLQNWVQIRMDCRAQTDYASLEKDLCNAVEAEYPNYVNWRSPFFSIWPEKRSDIDPVVSKAIKEKYCRLLLCQSDMYDQMNTNRK